MYPFTTRTTGFSRPVSVLLDIVIILGIFILVLLIEWLTDFDEIAINWLYHTRASDMSEYTVNGVLMMLLFSAYAIHRTIRYKLLLKKHAKTEGHLRASQHQLQMILDNSATILYTASPDQNIGNTYISGNVTAILGYKTEDFSEPGFWLKIIHPHDQQIVLDSFPKFFEQNYMESEFRARHHDGHWIWMLNRIHLIRDDQGTPKEIVGTWLDITERKRSQEAVTRSEQRFQKAAKATRDVIYDWDIKADVAWVNDQHFEVFGYARDGNKIGGSQWWSEKIHPEDVERVQRSLKGVLINMNEYWSQEYRFRRADGSYAYVLDRSHISYDAQGEPVHCVGSMSDLTMIKKAEGELRDAKKKAEQSARSKTEFLANMSHEIRTPLNGIIGMTDMVSESGLTSEQQHYIRVIQSSSVTLLGLINDILDFSKMDAGKLELSPAPFSIRDDFPRSLQALGFRAAEKNLEFVCRIDNDVPGTLIGDELRLQQIVTNLMGNAIKFTEQGEVSLRVQTKSVAADKVQLLFTISDTGVGIASDKLPYVFDKFMQADASTTRQFGGTGLGLAISKNLVELMGGVIWVESTEGLGSHFHFTAIFELQAGPAKSETRPTLPLLYDKGVLIVEDNKTTAEYLLEVLRHAGMKPVVVSNGKDAIIELMRAARLQRPYPLMLLDITLPGQVDGFDVADTVRNEPLLEGTGIIVVTISQKVSDRERFASLGIVDYIPKPFSQSDLLQAMNKLVSGHQQSKSSGQTDLVAGALTGGGAPDTGLKILLAEDNKVNQEVVLSVLTKKGHDVRIANNGLEAVRLLQRESFDLVLMDVQMPVMNGYEATQKIRQLHDSGKQQIPIIGLTANAMPGDREKCLDAGMNEYLSKPVNMKSLLATISKVHERSRITVTKQTCHDSGAPVKLKVGVESLLQKLDGNKTIVTTCIDLLREELPQMLTDLRMAIREKNTAGAKAVCHTLRGSLLTMEMHAAAKLVVDLETDIQNKNFEGKLESLQRLNREIEEAISLLELAL